MLKADFGYTAFAVKSIHQCERFPKLIIDLIYKHEYKGDKFIQNVQSLVQQKGQKYLIILTQQNFINS